MKFGSWTHKGKALTYSFYESRDKLDLTDYLKSGSWDIIDGPGQILTDNDGITGDEKQMIVFNFVLRRKTLFYTVNLIIPCVLISFVSICVFALPADAGEKITLCISVLLALIVFLLLVSKILPPSLTIPLIAKYLLFTFIMNLIAILSTVVIINRNYRTPRTHQMPHWVRVVFLRELPKYIFMKRPDHEERWEGKPSTGASSTSPTPPSFPSTPETRRLNVNMKIHGNTNTPSAAMMMTSTTLPQSRGGNNDLLELTEVHHPHCKLNMPGANSNPTNTNTNTSTNTNTINTGGSAINHNKDPTRHSSHTSHSSSMGSHHHHQHQPPPSYATCSPHSSHSAHSPYSSNRISHPTSQPSSHQQGSYLPRLTPVQQDSTDSSINNQFQMTPELHKTIEAVKFIYHHLKTEEEYETVGAWLCNRIPDFSNT